MSRLPHLLLAASFGLLAGVPALAQDPPAAASQEWIGVPAEQRKPPEDLQTLRGYLERIDAALKGLGEEDPLQKHLQSQKQQLEELERHLQELAGLDEKVAQLREDLEGLERQRKEVQERPEPTVFAVSAEELEQTQKDIESREDELSKVRDELKAFELDQKSERDLLALPPAESPVENAAAEVAAAREELAKALSEGADVAAVRDRLEGLVALLFRQAQLRARVKVAEAHAAAEFHSLRTRAAQQRIELLQLELARLRDLAAKQAADLERSRERERRSIEQELQAKEKELQAAPAYQKPFLQMELELLGLRRLKSEVEHRAGEWNARLKPAGDLHEAKTAADRVKRVLGDEAEELTAARLRSYLQGAERRRELIDRAQAQLREFRSDVHRWQREVEEEKRTLPAAIEAAEREARRLKPRGVYDATVRRYVDPSSFASVGTAIDEVLSGLSARLQKIADEDLKGYATGLESYERTVEANYGALGLELLWAREGSSISGESLERLLKDAPLVPEAVMDLALRWERAAVTALGAERRRLRIVLASVLAVLVVGGFAWLRSRLPHTPAGGADASRGDASGGDGGGEEAPRRRTTRSQGGRPKTGERVAPESEAPPATPPLSAALVLGLWLRRAGWSLVTALLLLVLPLILDLPSELVLPLAGIFASPFIYRALRVLLDLLLDPKCGCTGLAQSRADVARLLQRAGRFLLLLSVIFVPLGLAMEAAGYDDPAWNPGFVELWWLAYKVGLHVVLLASIFRPGVILRLVRRRGRLATKTFAGAALVYPVVVGLDLAVFTLSSLTYYEAAGFLLRNALKSAAVLAGAWILYRWALRTARPGRDISRKVSPDAYESDSQYREAARELYFDRLVRIVLRVFFFVPAIVIVFSVWPPFVTELLEEGVFTDGGMSFLDVVVAALVMTGTIVALKVYRGAMKFVVMPQGKGDSSVQYTVTTLVSYAAFTIGGVIALRVLRVEGSQITWFVSALAVGIGFGLQSIVRNLVSGIILLVERPVKVGDIVVVSDRSGIVDKITMRATTVMTWDGTGVVIPNERLIEGTLTNLSLGSPRLRTELAVSVAYGSPVSRVREVVMECAHKHGLVLKRPAPEVFFVGFGESSLDFQLWYWTSIDSHRVRVASDVRNAIEAQFRREGIQIPFPQRDLHVRHWPSPPPSAAGDGDGARESAAAESAESRAGAGSPDR